MTTPSLELMSRVRVAGPSDEDDVFRLCERMHKENEWGLRYGNGDPLPFSQTKVLATIRNSLYQPDASAPIQGRSFIGIVGAPGNLEGSISLSIASPLWSEAYFLAENWLFVLPEYRKSTNAKQLISFAKEFANTLQLPFVVGVFSDRHTEAKCRLYARALDQRAMGSIFLYNGDAAPAAI